jgi:hypothetical protein
MGEQHSIFDAVIPKSCSQGTVEEKAVVDLVAEKATEILVEYTNTSLPDGPERDYSQPALMRGVVSFVLQDDTRFSPA